MLVADSPAVLKGRVEILAPLRLTAAAGEMIGVIGPNGAGKSTLLRCLARTGRPAASVAWHGRPIEARRIAHLPQFYQIAARLTVLECVLLGRRERLSWHVEAADIAAAEAALAQFGLAGLASRSIDSLSGGQQQMVLIAQRLVREPVLTVLDEPTSALDLRHQIAMLGTLRQDARDRGAVTVLALHDLTMAARFCDRLVLLNGGRLVAVGTPETVLTEAALQACWHIQPEILTARDGRPVVVPH